MVAEVALVRAVVRRVEDRRQDTNRGDRLPSGERSGGANPRGEHRVVRDRDRD